MAFFCREGARDRSLLGTISEVTCRSQWMKGEGRDELGWELERSRLYCEGGERACSAGRASRGSQAKQAFFDTVGREGRRVSQGLRNNIRGRESEGPARGATSGMRGFSRMGEKERGGQRKQASQLGGRRAGKRETGGSGPGKTKTWKGKGTRKNEISRKERGKGEIFGSLRWCSSVGERAGTCSFKKKKG